MLSFRREDGPCDCGCHDHSKGTMHIMPCCAYTYRSRAEAEVEARKEREALGKDTTDEPPKYSIGQRVLVNGWGGHDFGTIVEIKRVYHNRMSEWVWGYRMNYEGNGPGLTLVYVPQGYLQDPPVKTA